MPSMEYHINYTEPSTLEFQRAKRRIEMEVSYLKVMFFARSCFCSCSSLLEREFSAKADEKHLTLKGDF